VKILLDCWDDLTASECQYGAYLFNGTEFSIYVSSWLDARPALSKQFSKTNGLGFVGHCVLKFLDVRSVQMRIATYSIEPGGRTKWSPSTSQELSGSGKGGGEYCLSGSLKGFFSSIDMTVNAARFELHVLESSEPAPD